MPNLDRIASKEIVSSVVALMDLLSEDHLEIIEKMLLEGEDVSFTKIKKATGLSGPPADSLASFLKNLAFGKDVLLVSLQAAIAARSHTKENIDTCDLIWTGPIQFPIPARSTLAVMKEMINEAKYSVIIVGYRIEEYAEPIIRSLYDAAKRNVRIRLVIDRAGNQMSIFKKIWKDENLPEFYSRKINVRDQMASVHAKLFIVDSDNLLVTSANLTYHGLSSNLEIGVRIKGKTADRAERLVNALIAKKYLVPG